MMSSRMSKQPQPMLRKSVSSTRVVIGAFKSEHTVANEDAAAAGFAPSHQLFHEEIEQHNVITRNI